MTHHRSCALIVLFMIFSMIGFSAVSAANEQFDFQNPRTPEPEEIDMEDWEPLEGNGVSLMAPPEFEGGSIDDMLELLEGADRLLGDEFDALLEVAQDNPELYKLFAVAPELMEGGVLTNINITGTPLPMELSMESILELMPESFPSSIEIDESEVIELGDYEEVGKLIIDMEILRIEQRLVLYLFLVDEQLYAITFTTSREAFKDLAPVFEQIASTFEVTEGKGSRSN